MVHGAIVVLVEALLLTIPFVGAMAALVDGMLRHFFEAKASVVNAQRLVRASAMIKALCMVISLGVCCVNRASFDGGRGRM